MTAIRFFCTRWGAAGTDWYQWAADVRAAGYEGVETDLPADPAELSAMQASLKAEGLQWVGQHWQTIEPDYARHKEVYLRHICDLIEAGPLYINSHTGRDWFTFEQNAALIRSAAELSAQSGVAIFHETHRGRFGFAAHATGEYLARIPEMLLTLDISHWVTVAESWLEDQTEAVGNALSRTAHVHARVGHPQGPQVADPRSPLYAEAIDRHLGWWDQVVRSAVQNDRGQLIFVPEFGPFPYMPLNPADGQPLADQWEINCHMLNLLKQRYQKDFLTNISNGPR